MQNFGGEARQKEPLGGPRREDIKMGLIEIGWVVVDWIGPAL